jgi:hypothetical protein
MVRINGCISFVVQVENPLTVAGLLQSLGLGKYNIIFRAEEVSWLALSILSQ